MSVKLAGNVSNVDMEVDAVAKAGRITLYDTAGNPIASIADSGGQYNLKASIVQDVIPSTLNSSTASIGAGVTWSGASETTLGIAGIQVNVFVDKRCTVSVLQSSDGANWDIIDSFMIPASFGQSRTFQATGSYYKVTVKNEEAGASGAGATRISTALCPIVEAMPRALSTGGNLKVTPSAEWQDNRKQLGLYGVSSFRTVGDTAGTQNMLTIENPVGSVVMMAVRSLNYMSDSTVALLTVAPQIKSSRTTGMPSNGTALTAVKYQTGYPAATAVVRGATASDGGGATAITATAGTTLWSQFLDRQATAVGLVSHPNYNMIPDVGADLRQMILLPGEAMLVQSVGALPATTHVVVNVSWIEMRY